MIKKGIILAGGLGTRMSPLTKAVNKQLLPIYDKPLIYYPLSILMLAKIRDILIIVNKGQLNQYKKLFPVPNNLGLNLSFKEQNKPVGLPDAFLIGEKFINNSNVAMILGDNFFYGQNLSGLLSNCVKLKQGAKIVLHNVKNPEMFGVAKINPKNKKILKISEKPKKFVSNYAITGLYFFDKKVSEYAKKQGAQKMSFDTIVASGARAAMPHAKPQNEAIMDNSMVLIDLGVYLDGYASDITRTQWIGQSNEKFERIYSLVKLAQEMASERCEAGMSGRDVHAIADTVFNEANISDLFIHGLGHGVGKAIHESPYLDKNSDDILKPGSIITIEPGIYIPGWGGIRIEDMFEVTDTKLRQITTADK